MPTRAPELRGPDFDAKFDGETLFYDVFFVTNEQVVLLGPPFLNLKSAIEQLRIVATPSKVECRFELRELDRNAQIHVTVPAGTTGLALASGLGAVDVAIQPGEVDTFAGRRVLFTLSKNNRLEWIADWVRYSRDIHGADAVLIYDNASDAYAAQDLAASLDAIAGIAAVRVVPWPFKYGPQGTMTGLWDSDFCQHGAWEHARRRFLSRAKSVQVSDIDELIVSPDGASVFEAVERSPLGVLRYPGRWVIGVEGRAPEPDQPGRRHRDYGVTKLDLSTRILGITTRRDPELCPPKWSVVPSRLPDKAQWKVHSVGDNVAFRPLSHRFSYRHFREITNGWKYERAGRASFDATKMEEDTLLRRHLDRVRWDL